VATFTVAGGQAWQTGPGGSGTTGAPGRTTERDPRNAYPTDRSESRVTSQVGGFALEGRPGFNAGEQRAEFVTRSIGEGATSAHAEAQLLRLIERMVAADPGWAARVRSIEINISESPCPSCTGLLVMLRRLFPGGLRFATVQWGQLHRGSNPTTNGDIARLAGSFTVSGPRS
jgi:hypothetical protein